MEGLRFWLPLCHTDADGLLQNPQKCKFHLQVPTNIFILWSLMYFTPAAIKKKSKQVVVSAANRIDH